MTEIDNIQFSILSKESALAMSVAEINTHDVFEKGIPKHGGLSDLRLGTIDRQFKCHTCKQDALGCPGHFGHINLGVPVYHICYLKYVVKILQCICLECKKCKINCNIKYTKHNKQHRYVYENSKSKMKCIHCDSVCPKIILEKYEIYLENETRRVLKPKEVLALFEEIAEDTLKILGFDPTYSHPKNMIISVMIMIKIL